MEQNGTVMRRNSSVRMGDGTAEQGCAEAKLGETLFCYGRVRRGVEEHWRSRVRSRKAMELLCEAFTRNGLAQSGIDKNSKGDQ